MRRSMKKTIDSFIKSFTNEHSKLPLNRLTISSDRLIYLSHGKDGLCAVMEVIETESTPISSNG